MIYLLVAQINLQCFFDAMFFNQLYKKIQVEYIITINFKKVTHVSVGVYNKKKIYFVGISGAKREFRFYDNIARL